MQIWYLILVPMLRLKILAILISESQYHIYLTNSCSIKFIGPFSLLLDQFTQVLTAVYFSTLLSKLWVLYFFEELQEDYFMHMIPVCICNSNVRTAMWMFMMCKSVSMECCFVRCFITNSQLYNINTWANTSSICTNVCQKYYPQGPLRN